jgi:hypothetical protein
MRPVVIAIHQPNYLPWLGYFRKLARADVFVFLDHAQFSKGSYTNRVQILRDGKAAWLTQPVQQALGQPISAVGFADLSWPKRHVDALHNAYRGASAFHAILPLLVDLIGGAPLDSLAAANRHLIEGLATRLGLAPRFVVDATLGIDGVDGDDRLIALINAVHPGATYLSGKGGRLYQDECKFTAAGIELRYSDYSPEPYAQAGATAFVPGLSVVDALFALGIEGTRALIVAPD